MKKKPDQQSTDQRGKNAPAQATNQYREKNCRVEEEPGVRLDDIPKMPLEGKNENRQQHGQRNAATLTPYKRRKSRKLLPYTGVEHPNPPLH
jgi:hypothetical protein